MADVTLTITIPERHLATIYNAYTDLSGNEIETTALESHKNYQIMPQRLGENNQQFVKRFIRQNSWKMVGLWKQSRLDAQWKSDIRALERQTEDVPEDIIT